MGPGRRDAHIFVVFKKKGNFSCKGEDIIYDAQVLNVPVEKEECPPQTPFLGMLWMAVMLHPLHVSPHAQPSWGLRSKEKIVKQNLYRGNGRDPLA